MLRKWTCLGLLLTSYMVMKSMDAVSAITFFRSSIIIGLKTLIFTILMEHTRVIQLFIVTTTLPVLFMDTKLGPLLL